MTPATREHPALTLTRAGCPRCQGCLVPEGQDGLRCLNCGHWLFPERLAAPPSVAPAPPRPSARPLRHSRPGRKIPLRCSDCQAEFIGLARTRYCPSCRWRHWGKPRKYVWTPERDAILRADYDSRVRNRTRAIADRFGWPVWCIKRRARELGLAKPALGDPRPWTVEEEHFLLAWAGRQHVNWIARRLKRGITSVVLKLKRSGLRRRVTEGYTLRMLAECFGTDHKTIERWVAEGKLRVHRRNPDRMDGPWLVHDLDVRRFVFAHSQAFRLDKVDQVWFMDLMRGAA